MIIDGRIKELADSIDRAKGRGPWLDDKIRELVLRLKERCSMPENTARYQAYLSEEGVVEPYPLDDEGYASSFDPLADEEGFFDCWSRYGIVVGRSMVSASVCERSIIRICELVNVLSGGKCNLSRPSSWNFIPTDNAGMPVISRGFFEVYHDEMLAELRQAVRIYIHHVILRGRADLWTSFDRLGVKLPEHKESGALPLHVDQNPLVHPDFRTTQGVLALTDCPVERGTFVGVPGSKKYFSDYRSMVQNEGEYVELDPSDPIAKVLQENMEPLPLRAGDLISWDSRTTHANSGNFSKKIRFVAYISAGPSKEDEPRLVNARKEAYRTGMGSNIRDALIHASKPPRYSDPEALARVRKPEKLNLLGKLLYGQERYQSL